jgi:hypothetical protein
MIGLALWLSLTAADAGHEVSPEDLEVIQNLELLEHLEESTDLELLQELDADADM